MSRVFIVLFLLFASLFARLGEPDGSFQKKQELVPKRHKDKKTVNFVILQVTGEGAAPQNMINPAQARILAKRAALADAYRKMSERVAGVMVSGRDKIENMVVTKSVVQTKVKAVVKNAYIVETKCDFGVCQVTLELRLRRKTQKQSD